MKKIITAFVFCFLCGECFSQGGEWVWIKGDSTYQFGYYGIQGVPSAFNIPPSLYESCEWKDLNGNFWLFGGLTGDYRGDLWKYLPVTNEWVWMKGSSLPNDTGNYGVQGVSSALNNPPSRSHGMASWVDNQNNLWMFGGGDALIPLNYSDLWKYNISTNEWTWMKGPNIPNQPGIYGIQGIPDPANNPPSMSECVSTWMDGTGDLWMFGGNSGFDDLWRYDISTNQWTWMRGLQSSISYGIKNIETSSNTPGARWAYSHWTDDSSRFWLFGGVDFQQTVRNDLWRYNPVTNNWTWINGDSTSGGAGYYNVKCLPSSNSLPLARFENRACWKDQHGNFWFFGGTSQYDHSITHNDLWMYCVATDKWIWQSGDSISNPSGHWGNLGVSNPLNVPPGRSGSIGWSDTNGHLYLFGGSISTFPYPFSDLWKYTIDTACGGCPISTGIPENNPPKADELLVFPNPANSSLTVSFQLSENQNVELRIYNTLGEIELSESFKTFGKFVEGKFEKEINVEKWSDGIYFLQLKTKNEIMNKKVIVQR